jgi:hypothetical protein
MKHCLPPAKNLGKAKDKDAMAHFRQLQDQGKAPMAGKPAAPKKKKTLPPGYPQIR